jgi:hypothetical protein
VNTSGWHLVFRVHAVRQISKRGISEVEIRAVFEVGEVIEDYPEDLPYRAQLILGRCGGVPLHIVASFDDASRTIFVVTVYEPNPHRWERGFRRRKRL